MRTLAPRPGVKSTGKASRYSVVKIIGRGSFGTAYLVRRKADSFLYVMKKLVLEQLGQRERAEAMNECAVLTKLRNHPNIVRVIEHFIDDGRLCIVMEYADGGDLAKRIEAQVASKSNFLEELVINWFVQICLALKHAHDRKILHRDLKPQNIFLTAKNSVRLGDFGISKVLSNTLSVASTCVGTPLYLAPELCEGKEYDSKSDVWSLGAILYELCALQPPFTANTMPALVMRICGNDPPPLASEISEPTRTLADRLLDKDPRQRPRVHDGAAVGRVEAQIVAVRRAVHIADVGVAAAGDAGRRALERVDQRLEVGRRVEDDVVVEQRDVRRARGAHELVAPVAQPRVARQHDAPRAVPLQGRLVRRAAIVGHEDAQRIAVPRADRGEEHAEHRAPPRERRRVLDAHRDERGEVALRRHGRDHRDGRCASLRSGRNADARVP